MKKSLLALAALTAFAGVASAQSSVTLFGVVDVAARSVKNGSQSIKSLSSDGNASSRLGFRGIEDLGDGMRAGFWLEAGMSPDTGGVGAAGGSFFNRRATASLLGGFGEVRLGRDYTPSYWNHAVFDPFGGVGIGAATNLVQTGATVGAGNAAIVGAATNTTRVLGVPGAGVGDARSGTFVRADNAIGYFLPALGGLYGQLMVAAGEGVVGNKYQGGRLGYAAGPVNVAAAYGRTRLSTNNYFTEWNVGASFAFGPFILMGQYSDFDVDNGEPASATSYGIPGGRNMKNGMIGATWTMGAGTLKVSGTRTKGDLNRGNAVGPAPAGSTTALDASATQLAVAYVYDLSKRTAVYTSAARIKNKNGAHFYVGGSGPAYTNTTANFTSTGYEFGVRHNF